MIPSARLRAKPSPGLVLVLWTVLEGASGLGEREIVAPVSPVCRTRFAMLAC